jgi:hypothetical protein
MTFLHSKLLHILRVQIFSTFCFQIFAYPSNEECVSQQHKTKNRITIVTIHISFIYYQNPKFSICKLELVLSRIACVHILKNVLLVSVFCWN